MRQLPTLSGCSHTHTHCKISKRQSLTLSCRKRKESTLAVLGCNVLATSSTSGAPGPVVRSQRYIPSQCRSAYPQVLQEWGEATKPERETIQNNALVKCSVHPVFLTSRLQWKLHACPPSRKQSHPPPLPVDKGKGGDLEFPILHACSLRRPNSVKKSKKLFLKKGVGGNRMSSEKEWARAKPLESGGWTLGRSFSISPGDGPRPSGLLSWINVVRVIYKCGWNPTCGLRWSFKTKCMSKTMCWIAPKRQN